MNKKGITLIALVITIIVLLILAGISLNLITGGEGILNKASTAVNKTQESAIEEELNLEISKLRMEAVEQGKSFDVKYIAEELPKSLKDCICSLNDDEKGIEGEYKDYIFTVDEKCVVQIESKVGGIKPEITAEVITEGYVLEGENAEIEIQVRATIPEGSVSISVPEGVTLKSMTTDAETEKVYVYTTNQNASYIFMAVGGSGRKNKSIVEVNQIIDKPRIKITNNIGTAFTINVENDYPQGENITYTYYLGTEAKATNIEEKSYTIEGLTKRTEYVVRVQILYNGQSLISDEITVTTTGLPLPPVTVMTPLEENIQKTALEYPILTYYSVMNCTINCALGDRVRIEIENDSDITNYYSVDGGENWIKYTGIIEINYPGDGLLKAKSENMHGSSEIKDIKAYAYDSSIECTGPTTGDLMTPSKEVYDKNYVSYADCDTPNTTYIIQVEPECWEKYVTFYSQNGTDYGYVQLKKEKEGSSLKERLFEQFWMQ